MYTNKSVVIDPITKQKIFDSAQILDIVSDFVSLKKRGSSYVGLCPFHADRNPSFYVTPSKNICKCFACGEGGSPVNFLMKLEQMSYVEALKYIANKYGIPIQERELTDEEKEAANERQSLFIANQFAQDFFHKQLETEEGMTIGLSYFTEREIRLDTIEKFGLGYAPSGYDTLYKSAVENSYEIKFFEDLGLINHYEDNDRYSDRFRERVMFPVYNLSGNVVAFGGRILKKDEKLAKYINSKESSIYSKSRELYGLFQAKHAISKLDKCYLVEGYLDVLQMTQSGIENVVASSGTALTKDQIRLIRRFTPNITCLFDGDNAGIKAAMRGINLLLEEGINVKVIRLPQEEDPDSLAKKLSASELVEYLNSHEEDFINFKTELLLDESKNDPMLRAKLISDIVGSIALIPEDIIRAVYIQSTAQRLDMSEDLLVNEVRKARNYHNYQVQTELNRQQNRNINPQTASQQPRTAAQPTVEIIGGQPVFIPADEDASTVETPQVDKESELSIPIKKYEQQMLMLIVRQGEYILDIFDEQQQRHYFEPIAKFIAEELLADKILDFATPACQAIIKEAAEEVMNEVKIPCQQYFINHINPYISQVAVDLVADPYPLSSIMKQNESVYGGDSEEKRKEMEVKKNKKMYRKTVEAIYIFKNAYILHLINELQQKLASEQDPERQAEILTDIQHMNDIKAEFAKALGERIIL
ncbi:DNA primase [Falsiporphyromonas endometrii]|uniref:DNA primase n=1 Tax=Falsiporphyromonas endometrii TaxID=1387297 RepID=A0ABV9K989_9PORP